MKYAVVINKHVKNMRVVVVLKKLHDNESFLTKFLLRMISKKQEQSTPVMQKWTNAK